MLPNIFQQKSLDAFASKDLYTACIFAIVFGIMCIVGDIIDTLNNYVTDKMSKDISITAQNSAADWFFHAKYQNIDKQNDAEIMMHEMEVMNSTGSMVKSLTYILMLITITLFSFYLAFTIDPFATFLSFIIIEPIRILITRKFAVAIKLNTADQVSKKKTVWKFLSESFSGRYDIRTQHFWGLRYTKICSAMQAESKAFLNISKNKNLNSVISFAIINIITAFVLIRSLVRGFYGEITVGQIVIILAYFQLLQSRISGTVSSVVNFIGSKTMLETDMELYGYELESDDHNEGHAEPIHTIQLHNISFAYPGNETNVIKNVTASFTKGKMYAITGKNGSGKTSIAKLILRLYDLSTGQIFINDKPIASYSPFWIRTHIAYFPQSPILFSESIRDNMTYLNPDADDNMLWSVLRMVGMDRFVAGMPQGIDTVLSDGGASLSGGQKQRLCFAKNLLTKKDVYLLDEPTSSIDAETELLFRELLHEIKCSSIVIVITHDQRLMDAADEKISL